MGQDHRKALETVKYAFLLIAVLVIGIAFVSDMALSFPANVRGGYPACGACHVAPDGGGAVNKYGRDTIPARMATWKMKYEQEPLHGAARGKWPEWFSVGGDVRYINVTARGSNGFQYHNKFVMQRDIEVALHANEHITVAAQVGVYGPDEGTGQEIELRKHYLKLQLNPYVGVRLGRFVPTYGLAEADHELPTRKRLNLGQGDEVVAGQVYAQTEWGEAFLTAVAGKETTIEATETKGETIAPGSYPKGAVAKISAFLGEKSQVGLSAMNLALGGGAFRQAIGVHGLSGVPWNEKTYGMLDFSRVTEAGVPVNVAMARVGHEALRGIHVLATYDLDDKTHSPGFAVQWFPRPHFEVLAQWDRAFLENSQYVDSGVLMFHYYL